jgi:hypothetical protein
MLLGSAVEAGIEGCLVLLSLSFEGLYLHEHAFLPPYPWFVIPQRAACMPNMDP